MSTALWPSVQSRLDRILLDLEHIQRELHISYRRIRANEMSCKEKEAVRNAMVNEGVLRQQVMELLTLKDADPSQIRPLMVGKVAV